jgi:hypothetical protein
VADFHATRHTYISGIVAGGKASVKTCQELARHSTPVLTIGRYAHTQLHDITGALDALPDVTTTATPAPAGPRPQELAATGTDGQQVGGGSAHNPPHRVVGTKGVAVEAAECSETGLIVAECGGWNAACNGQESSAGDGPQVLAMAGFGNKKAACDGMRLTEGGGEAPVGVEPTVADLQSAALATWRRRHELLET